MICVMLDDVLQVVAMESWSRNGEPLHAGLELLPLPPRMHSGSGCDPIYGTTFSSHRVLA